MWNEAQQQVNKRAVILVVEIVEVPPDEEMYQRGIRQKCRYKLETTRRKNLF
ncbi:hypothetical protein [Chroococcidiopsis sp. CCALA 051]|uniref:hypothetical protein n=1 Tax=Chroococcidiopsis sp. CCALA 051 TaxID=869949 RepID=UPI0013050272|nr:hypothetical protein [Chroococcidiopsis sp. CCALA 051]